MVSLIDPSKPAGPVAFTVDVRNNFAAAKSEIEALQAATSSAPFLPIAGGIVEGHLRIAGPSGATDVGLALGAVDQTGFYVQGSSSLGVAIQGAPVFIFNPGLTFCRTEFDVQGFHINNVGDAVNPTDALNLRTADARYSPVTLADDVAALRAELAMLKASITT